MPDQEWYSLKDIADALNLDPSTIRLWVRDERIHATKVGGRAWRVHRDEFQRVLREGANRDADGYAPARERSYAEDPEAASLDSADSVMP